MEANWQCSYQAVEQRVCRVHVGPQELKPQETSEGEDASHGCLGCAVRLDENQHSRQKDPPAALSHLEVVQPEAWGRMHRGQRWYGILCVCRYQRGMPTPHLS